MTDMTCIYMSVCMTDMHESVYDRYDMYMHESVYDRYDMYMHELV
jgi:hypothetical protein